MTLPSTVPLALAALKAARYPEAILGKDPNGFIDQYRLWVKIVHEDLVPAADKAAAHEAFLLLTKIRAQAESKVAAGTYGNCAPSVIATLRTKTAVYDLVDFMEGGDIADFYIGDHGGKPVLVKVCRSATNNDLMKTEADILASLPAKLDPKHTAYFPNLLDSFEVPQGAAKVRVNVFSHIEGAVSLRAIIEARPLGLDPKDAAWMWNRQLEALHLLHVEGYIHANVTPNRFLVVPATHQGVLTDFCYARKAGQPAKAISPDYKRGYPKDLLDKKGLDFGVDLHMSAFCMNTLIGGSWGAPIHKNGISVAIGGLLRSCWLGAAHRPKSAKTLHADFKEIRKGLGWKKEFRPFSL